GYFVDPSQPHWGEYRQEAPIPACGKRQMQKEDHLLLYIPKLEEESDTYDDIAIIQSVQQLQRNPFQPLQNVTNMTMQRGQALVIEISDTGMIHKVLIVG
ncbi:MAG: hypothetical protein AAGF95_17645, partial [Chloroflexota bacterium]